MRSMAEYQDFIRKLFSDLLFAIDLGKKFSDGVIRAFAPEKFRRAWIPIFTQLNKELEKCGRRK